MGLLYLLSYNGIKPGQSHMTVAG
ncbi:hypothetical protein KL86CLO1_11630 [uncultured Eubacteriales bacterium]|uniref:Uncharacterized protein n=1 Tax=uncultured Eubacteriales bacterium TaxID=172733 RepID=A0A212JS81_9FIRM|nr:hypothetical protein KL86CLO1_11630 [uncultured Eubacteriales bacterium]